jgi:hypothetical protein
MLKLHSSSAVFRCHKLMAMTTTYYVCFCPCSEACKKGGTRLGSFKTEDEARQKIVHHLTHSSHHNMDEQDANGFASESKLEEEQHDDSKAAKGKGKGEGKGEGSGWKRSEPYAWGGSSTGNKSWDSWSSSSNKNKFQVAVVGHEVDHIAAIVRCETSARQAAKVARAAALAFDDEAATLAQELARLRYAKGAK